MGVSASRAYALVLWGSRTKAQNGFHNTWIILVSSKASTSWCPSRMGAKSPRLCLYKRAVSSYTVVKEKKKYQSVRTVCQWNDVLQKNSLKVFYRLLLENTTEALFIECRWFEWWVKNLNKLKQISEMCHFHFLTGSYKFSMSKYTSTFTHGLWTHWCSHWTWGVTDHG